MIVSHTVFIWFCTAMTAGISGAWLIVEVFRVRKLLREDFSRPVVRDRLFGTLVGFAVAIIGVVGMLRYHL